MVGENKLVIIANLIRLVNIMGKTYISLKLHDFGYELRWYRDNSSLCIGRVFLLEDFMNELFLFAVSFFFVLLIYEIFVVSKTKKAIAKGKDNPKQPMEVKYLINVYKLDVKKVNYNQLLQIISIVSSLDISIVASLINIPDSFILEILIGFVGLVGTAFFSYHLVYLFYKKKGLIIND